MSSNLALKLIMNADDGLSNVVKRAVNTTDSEFEKLQNKLNQTSEKFTNFGKASMIAGGVIAAPLAFGVKMAADFEGQLSSIEAVTGATSEEMDKLRTLALKMGADTKFSALEAAQGVEELEKAGVSTAQILNGGLSGALSLAAAGDLALAESAEIASTALNAFKADNLSVIKAADILSGAANASATSVGELKYSLSACSSVASGIGMNFKDTNIALALFAQNGLKGSDAGTSLKSMLMNLQPRTDAQVSEFVRLGLATGKLVKVSKDGKEKYEMLSNAFFTSQGKLKSLSEISGLLKTKMAGLTDQQRMFALETMFGSDAIRAANILFKEGEDGANSMWSAMSKVTAEQVAAKKMDNLKGSIEELGGSIETVAISFGSKLTPAIDVIAKGATALTNGFMAMPEPIQSTIAITGALAAVSLIALGGVSLAAGAVTKGFSNMLGAYRAMDLYMWANAPKMQKVLAATSKSFSGLIVSAIGGIRTLGVAIASTPFIGQIGLVLAGVAFLIYKYWKPISGFFKGLFSGIAVALKPLKPAFASLYKTVGVVVSAISNRFTFLKPVFGFVSKAVSGVVSWFKRLIKPVDDVNGKAYNMGNAIGKALGGAVGWCVNLIGKFEKLITLGGRIKIGGGADAKGKKVDGTYATGLSNVPFDGYVAELHRDEAVLTAKENKQWQSFKKGNSGSISITYAPNVQISSGSTEDGAKFLNMLKKHKQELLALIESTYARREVRVYA